MTLVIYSRVMIPLGIYLLVILSLYLEEEARVYLGVEKIVELIADSILLPN